MLNLNRQRIPALGPILAAAVAALVIYAITLGGTFIYDDLQLLDEPRITHPRQWAQFFTESYNYGVDNLYRPLVLLSFGIQWLISGFNTIPLHTVNWLLHAAVSALVATLGMRLTLRRDVGLIAGLLFAALPIHVEAVAGLVGRAELMCAVGMIGGLSILLRRRITVARALAATGCLLLAMGSKEQGMLLPALAILLPLCLGVRRPVDERERQAMLWLIVLGCFTTAGFVIYRESILKFGWDRSLLDWTQQPLMHHGADKIRMPIALLGRYAALLVWPAQLSIDYGYTAIGWRVAGHDPYLWIGAAVAVSWMAAILIAWRMRAGAVLFCLLATALLYALVGNFIVIIGVNFGERLMYLPSVFLCILAAMAVTRLPRPIMFPLVFIAVVAGGIRSFAYARQWNDRMTFYRTQLAEQPNSVHLHMLVARELLHDGHPKEAAEADRIARELAPDYWDLWTQSAQMALANGNIDEAKQDIDRSMDLRSTVRANAWYAKINEARAATQAASTQPATQPTQSATVPSIAR